MNRRYQIFIALGGLLGAGIYLRIYRGELLVHAVRG